MSTYYWDIIFHFNAGGMDVGLVDVVSGTAQDTTSTCTQSNHGLAHNFANGDSVCFNIFDGDGGCALTGAKITFTNSAAGAAASPFDGNSTISLGSAEIALNQMATSAAFPPSWYRHWVFPQYTVTNGGTFYFSISLTVTSGGGTKTITKDPEMIVGGPAGT